MTPFSKWFNKQNDLTLRMATPEIIAKAAWDAAIERCAKIAMNEANYQTSYCHKVCMKIYEAIRGE